MMTDTCDDLSRRLIAELKKRDWKVTTVESCTGGMVSSVLVDIPGASDVLEMAFVTYSDRAKEKLVGVRRETLLRYTAVSGPCCREMASGGADVSGADLSLAVTGYAGGLIKQELDGLVYIGCACHGKYVSEELHIDGDRMTVRKAACRRVLQLGLTLLTNC